jgi:thioredoxin 1
LVRSFDMPIITNDQSVDRVLNAGLPIVFVFLDSSTPADLDPAMNRLARENAGKILVVKVSVKDSPNTRQRYAITRTPAVVTVRNHQEQSLEEGISAADLEKHAAYLLGNGPRPAVKAQPGASAARPAAGKAQPKVVTDANFDAEVLGSSQPVLVDFWAVWCGPCRMVEPVVEKLAYEYAGRLKVVKVNVDENPMISQRYGIQSIPTMMMVKNGKVVDRWMGAMPENAIRSRVTPVI